MDRSTRRGQLASYLVLVPVAVFVIVPIWILVILATDASITGLPDSFRLWPADPTLQRLVDAWVRPDLTLDFLGLLRNSLFVAGCAAGASLLFGASMAYAFARMRFPGNRAGLVAILAGACLPLIALAVPIYFIFLALENSFPALREFGLRGSTVALAILYAAFAMPLCVWLMRSAFRAVPADLEEAAFVEGATRAVAFRRITLPLAAPSILVAALVAFLLAYSEFALAWLFATKEENETLAMELAGAQIGFYSTEWGPTAAHALLMTIPVVIVFLALQRLLLRANLATTATD
ncbi:MAG: transporter permease [Chloroflexi bacterium]|nr:transporter permease [Chloroflexota bacterium]